MDESAIMERYQKNRVLSPDDEMILHIIGDYNDYCTDIEDLIAEGYLGLAMAYAEYRKDKINTPFSILAVRLIRQCIEDFIERHKNTWFPADSVIAGVNPDTLASEPSLTDSYFENLDEAKNISILFNTLSYRSRAILLGCLGIGLYNPYSLEEIGDIFALSKERAKQIRDTAIYRLTLLSYRYRHFRNPSRSSIKLLLNAFFLPNIDQKKLVLSEKHY